jgi:hypothetical protein
MADIFLSRGIVSLVRQIVKSDRSYFSLAAILQSDCKIAGYSLKVKLQNQLWYDRLAQGRWILLCACSGNFLNHPLIHLWRASSIEYRAISKLQIPSFGCSTVPLDVPIWMSAFVKPGTPTGQESRRFPSLSFPRSNTAPVSVAPLASAPS